MTIEPIAELLKLTVFVGLLTAGILAILTWKKGLTTKVSYLRFFVQAISELGIFILISYPLWLGVVLAVLMLVTFFIGRFFCGWICPFGFYMDLVTLFRKSLKKRYVNLPERINLILHRLRYVLLVWFLFLPFILSGPITIHQLPLATFLIDPFNPLRILLGPMVPIITPWKILNGLNLNYPYADQIVHYSSENSALANVVIFVALSLIVSFAVRRFWCRFCPTGSSTAVVNRIRGFKWVPLLHLSKDEAKCSKCGICKRVCPLQVAEVYERKGGRITTSMCMLCLRCVEMCPSKDALKVKVGWKTIFCSRNWLEPSKSE